MITIEPPSSSSIPAMPLQKPGLTRFLNRARAAVGVAGEVEVLLTSDAELKRLNRSYRGKNKATDVLSFPTPAEIAEHHAGDLAISLDTAGRQAAAYGHSLEVEVKVLLLHGLLHLSGLDHETDDGEMAAREAELRTKLRLPVSLIDRVTNPAAKKKTTAKKAARKKAGA
jgi:probable rRNA maturation factor